MTDSAFAKFLYGKEEIRISVVRRKDGKRRTLPIWFAVEGTTLQLLPMYGLNTQWFRDVEKNSTVEIRTGREMKSAVPRIIRDPAAVDRVKQRFSHKYGSGEVRKYYPTSEVALEISLQELPSPSDPDRHPLRGAVAAKSLH